jgi:hypothetical protein
MRKVVLRRCRARRFVLVDSVTLRHSEPAAPESKLEAAIVAAVAEGRKCYDDMDESEMTVAIKGSRY